MGYLQALKLMVRAYKAARGVMPKGLDLLKLKMRARQKAIDSKKVIQFPKDKITPFNKPSDLMFVSTIFSIFGPSNLIPILSDNFDTMNSFSKKFFFPSSEK